MKLGKGLLAMTALTSYLFCGAATTTQGCNAQNESIGPSEGEVVGVAIAAIAVIAVGTVVLVEVHNGHHTIKGCATLTPDGVQVLNEGDHKTYTITGITEHVKVGDRVKVHGNKEKQPKGSTAAQVFTVQKLNKDYGACPATPSTAATSTATQ